MIIWNFIYNALFLLPHNGLIWLVQYGKKCSLQFQSQEMFRYNVFEFWQRGGKVLNGLKHASISF